MDPLQLEMFVTVKDCDSLSKASTLLKVPSRDIVKAIQALEQQLQTPIFLPNSYRLTFEGHMLYLNALGELESWYIAQGIIYQLKTAYRY